MTHPEMNLRGEFLFKTLFWTLINAENADHFLFNQRESAFFSVQN